MQLQVGDKAPNFNTVDQNDAIQTLEQYQGKKVILYFYPKDNTPGCTTQSCNLRDNYDSLLKQGYVVLGASACTQAKHINFAKKYNLPFPLLVDTEMKILEAYGVWQEKNTFGKTYMGIVRTTFVIDEKGIIEEMIKKVNTKEHTEQILSK